MKPNCTLLVRIRRAAAICLLAYLQAAGFLPYGVALGAWLEGSHAVWVERGPQGLTIVLHHSSGQQGGRPAALRPAHRHGMASQVFCLLAKTGRGPLADHVAAFEVNSACAKAAGKIEASSAQPHYVPVLAARGPFSPRSPPACPAPILPLLASLRTLRVTVLLV